MFLLDWYKQYLDIKTERAEKLRELQYCEACETLKLQLAVANEERKFLIEKLTANEEHEEPKKQEHKVIRPIMPARMNWNVRKQMLEAEDRAQAKILRENEKANKANKVADGKALTVHEIEKELGVAE